MPEKACPFDKQPCIKERCMAWSGKVDLEKIEQEHKESFDALLNLTAMQEMVSIEQAREIIKIRNEDERCKLISPEPPV